MNGVEHVAPHPERDQSDHAAGERRRECSSPARDCKPGEDRQREAGGELRPETECGRRTCERGLEPATPEEQARCNGDERGGNEIVLSRERLEREHGEGGEQKCTACSCAHFEPESPRRAVDGDENRELGEELRQEVQRAAAGGDE